MATVVSSSTTSSTSINLGILNFSKYEILIHNLYYKIAGTNKYRQCDSSGCMEVSLESKCEDSTIGRLFTNGNDGQVALCLKFFDNEPVWTSIANSGKYLLKYHANNNIFGLSNNQYGLFAITQNSITLSEESKGFIFINIII